MPEKLLDISQAKQFLNARKANWHIWHLIETGRSKGIWVDGLSHITSLMVSERLNDYPKIKSNHHNVPHKSAYKSNLFTIFCIWINKAKFQKVEKRWFTN